MKKTVLILVFLLTIFSLNAQEGYRKVAFGLGANASLPLGDVKNFGVIGRGANLQLMYRLPEKSSELTFQISTDYFENSASIFSDNLIIASALVGGRYYLSPIFIAGVNVGYGYVADNAKYSKSGFAFSPEIGVTSKHTQALLHYTTVLVPNLKASVIGFRMAYIF